MQLQRREMIKEKIKECLRDKFRVNKPETDNMPFHSRLLGKDRMALYSFIHSINTKFEISLYESVAIALAKERFKIAETQVKPGDKISLEAHQRIQTIMNGLSTAERDPNKSLEIQEIRGVCTSGKLEDVKLTNVDVWLETDEGELFLIDFKTVKPNKGDFQKFKRTLLEWSAAELARNPDVVVNALIGIPYNPYEPKPYQRWTLKGMFDLKHDILIAEDLWDFIGGQGSYDALLNAFEQAGIELRNEIDEYFANFK